MTTTSLAEAHRRFLANLSQISEFWGLPRATGAIFGALYLSPEPVSLDRLVQQVGVTKGTVSTNVRALERMGLIRKQLRVGERTESQSAAFYQERLQAMEDFFKSLDTLVATLLQIDRLRASGLQWLTGAAKRKAK